MVELLVALAICAVLAMGAGTLISLGLQLRDRVEQTERVQQALLDLRAVNSAFGGGTGVGLEDVKDGMFQLCLGSPGQDRQIVGTFLLSTTGSASYRTTSNAFEADISVFETRVLEYLVETPAQQDWRSAGDLADARPIAARLLLGLGKRTWRMLLWLERSSPGASSQGERLCAA